MALRAFFSLRECTATFAPAGMPVADGLSVRSLLEECEREDPRNMRNGSSVLDRGESKGRADDS